MRSFPKFLSLTLLVASLTACEKDQINLTPDVGTDADAGDASHDADVGQCLPPDEICGEECCEAPGRCVAGECVTCERQCEGKRCGPDGCGGTCGECAEEERCVDGLCEKDCADPETDAAFCMRLMRCGQTTAQDRCGETRTVDCTEMLGCTSTQRCAAAGDCVCADTPEDGDYCPLAKSKLHVECGAGEVEDQCGALHTFDCGDPCIGAAYCGPSNVCDCPEETEAELCARHGKDCGRLQAPDLCGRVVVIPDCAEALEREACASPNHCLYNVCVPTTAPPANNECAEAEPLWLYNGKVEFDADTSKATDSGDGRCNRYSAFDLVYELHLDRAMALTIESTPTSAVTLPNLYVQSSCGSALHELGCIATGELSTRAVLQVPRAGPGSVYLWVDGYGIKGHGAGPQHVEITGLPVDAPTNDTCAEVERHVLTPARSALSLNGSTALALNELTPSCAPAPWDGKELIYAITTPTDGPRTFSAKLTPAPNSFYWPTLSIRRGCEDTEEELLCHVSADSGLMEALLPEVEPGSTLFLVVDSHGDLTGDFVLEVSSGPRGAPPLNATCASLEANAAQFVPVQDPAAPQRYSFMGHGTVKDAADSAKGSCMGATGGRDVRYPIHIGAQSSVQVMVARASYSLGYLPAIYLRSQCEGEAEVAGSCAVATEANPTATFFTSSLAPGDYYLVVDSATAGEGDFTVDLYIWSPPIANSACNAAPEYVLTTGVETRIVGNTRGGANTTASSCKRDASARELVYKVQMPPEGHYDLLLSYPRVRGATNRPFISIRRDCASTAAGSEIYCQGQETLIDADHIGSVGTLKGGATYSFWLEEPAGTVNGLFELELVALRAGIPTHAVCETADPVTPDLDAGGRVTLSGKLRDTADDYVASCAASYGADLVYRFDPGAEVVNYRFSLTAKGSDDRLAIYIRDTCAEGAADVLCHGQVTSALTKVFEYRGVDRPFYLFIDTVEPANASPKMVGDFTLEVWARRKGEPPQNDLCGGARELVPDAATGKVSVRDFTTSDANGDYMGSCTPKTEGENAPDMVYKVHVTSPSKLSAILATSRLFPDFRPSVYIRRENCMDETGASEVACANAGSSDDVTYGIATAAATVSPGWYYIFVDGVDSASHGDASLEVLVRPVAPLSDSCAGAEMVELMVPGSERIEGDTSAATHSTRSASLSYGNGPDVVYELRLNAAARLDATLAFVPAYGIPVLYLRDDCTGATADDELGAVRGADGSAISLSRTLPAGTYWIWIDSHLPLSGPFSLLLETTALPSAPAHSLCATPEPLALVQERLSFRTSTVAGSDNAYGTCGGAGGIERYYLFTPPVQARGALRVQVRREAGPANYSPVVYLRKVSCGAAMPEEELACATASGGVAEFSVEAPYPGPCLLVVDGEHGGGEVSVTIDLLPELWQPTALPDTCPEALPLSLNGAGRARVRGDTSNALDSTSSTCAGSAPGATPGRDVVYLLDLAALSVESDLLLSVDFSPNKTIGAALMIRGGSCSSLTSERCERQLAGGGAALTWKNLPAERYWIWVDAAVAGEGAPFTLDVELRPTALAPPEPEVGACAAAIPALEFVDGVALVRDTTLRGSSAMETGCGQSPSGKELLYSFSIASAPVEVAILAAPSAGSAHLPNIELRRTCGQVASAVGCAAAVAAGQAASFTAQLAQAGTYYLWVDGNGAGADGPFTLAVIRSDATVSGDNCTAQAESLTLKEGRALAAGRFQQVAHDGTGFCGAMVGPDRYYGLSLTGEGDHLVRAVVTSGSAAVPAVYVRRLCASAEPANEVACAVGAGAVAATDEVMLQSGDYYVVVDTTTAGATGSYTLEVVVEPVIVNDTCQSALTAPPLQFVDGRASTVIASVQRAHDDMTGTCTTNPMQGPDLIFPISVPANTRLSAAAYPSANVAPALYLRRSCALGGASNQFECKYTRTLGQSIAFNVLVAEAGTYYLVLDATNAEATGSVRLDVAMTPGPVGGLDDDCQASFPESAKLHFVDGRISFGDTLDGATNNGAGSCAASMTGPDKVYAFTLESTRMLTASLSRSEFAPALYLRSRCDQAGSEVSRFACKAHGMPGNVASIKALALEPGEYYLWVDSTSPSAAGSFWLDVALSEAIPTAVNDDCASPFPPEAVLSFQAGKALLEDTLADATHGTSGNCASMMGPDKVYAFDLDAPAQVTAEISKLKFAAALYIRSECGASNTEVSRFACASAKPEETVLIRVSAPNLPRGRYYLWVDSRAPEAEGEFTLTVTLSSPVEAPANDTCAEPMEELSFLGGTVKRATASGDLTGAENSGNGSCGAMPGGDVVYKMTLGETRKVTVTATALGNFKPGIYLRSGCGAASSEVSRFACALVPALSLGKVATFTIPSLSADTYYLWVDAGSFDATGTFNLEVRLEAPVASPANDACGDEAAIPALTFVGDVARKDGDIGSAKSDTTGLCADMPGGDLVYKFTLNGARKVTVSAQGTGFSPALILRRSCAGGPLDQGELGCAVKGLPIVRRSLPEGTYYVWVDGTGASDSGTFTLTVSLAAELPLEQGDTCADAIPLMLGVLSGPHDLKLADDNYAWGRGSGCSVQGTPGGGPDLVFAYKATSAPFKVIVNVAGGVSWNPAFWVATQCDYGACVRGADVETNSSPETATIANPVAGTDYYIFVDVGFGSGGQFTIHVVDG